MGKFAIKLELAKDDWIYVQREEINSRFERKPKLFNTVELAEIERIQYGQNATIVIYE